MTSEQPKMKRQIKIIVLLLILMNLSCLSFAKPKAVAYLMPEGFTGGVIILYNQADGSIPETANDGTVLYRIPKDGLLKLKQSFEENVFRYNFYYIDDKDNLMPIEYVQLAYYVRDPGDTTTKTLDTLTEDERNNRIFIINHRTTTFDIRGEKVYLQNFIIGKPKDADNLLTKLEFRIADIEEELSNK